ncbi:MAG: CocE/NonD family hydrolase [Chloroflexi bacterium]|nr:CocE/NonD family hydrolase [Chloroflexota bacterium]MDA1003637.1 CocE/NonD family hydrolase [Chloroflexota bacterium]
MPDPSHADFGAILARNVEMRARDGVRLATDVWRPALNGETVPGPFPAMLIRTPYNRTGDNYAREGEFWAAHGYLLVVQDVRGRWDSEGEFVLLANEGPDGYDAVEWVAELPYCDGNVGTYGTSYLAWVQSALALERPPHLRAMWVHEGAANGHTSSLRHNGTLELRWLTWAVTWGAVSPEARRDPSLAAELRAHGLEMYEWLRRLPWSEGNSPLERLPAYNRWARDLYEQGDAGPYWLSMGRNFEEYFDISADVPTVYSGGWYDSYTRATTDSYVGLSTRIANQRLLMGPWTHGDAAFERSYSGDVDLGSSAPLPGNLAPSRRHLQLRWFDRWLKGVREGVDDDQPVRIFVMGGGSGERTAEGRLLHGGYWRAEAEWPLARAVATPFYLRAGDALDPSPPAGGEAEASTFVYDPADPLPTISANTSSLNEFVSLPERVPALASPTAAMRVMVVQGGADQRTRPDLAGAHPPFAPLEERADVLAFTTPPLASDVEVTGPIEATLFLSSDAPDTDLFVMLQDVYPPSGDWPDGYRLNIADGIMRVRYREGTNRPATMAPGEVYEVRFALYPTSNRFVAGHRMRVLVSSSSFPRFDPNPNTGEPIGRHTRTQRATNTIHHSATYPSHVTLPVVPIR